MLRGFLLCICLFAFNAIGDTEIHSAIYEIDQGTDHEEPLIFLTTGQVVTLPAADKTKWNEIKQALIEKSVYRFVINEKRQIVLMERSIQSKTLSLEKIKIRILNEPYEPSILKNIDVAMRYFYDARTDHREESQCFNRAHVWAYEWRKKNQLYSSKAWIFFTRRYIRKHKFEWWFHVAPMVHVISENKVKERVMDIKYARGPLSLKKWTDIFMRDGADCPVVEKYTDHANYPESGSCFVMKSSMYYYQPVDLEQLELTGIIKSRWIEPEVMHAYADAFLPATTEEQL